MATQSELRQYTEAAVTPRAIEDAYRAAETLLAAYTQAEEVRPGLRLCIRGRLYRAMVIAGTQPEEKRAALAPEIERLGALAQKRFDMFIAAERHYRDLCRRVHVEPAPSPLPPCACEGCRMEAEAIAHLQGAA